MNALNSEQDNTMPTNDKHFDMLTFVKESKRLGVPEELAEFQARQLENVIDIASYTIRKETDARDPATKADLKQTELVLTKDIKQLDIKIAQLETDVKVEIKQLETDLKVEIKQLDIKIAQLETDLKVEIKQLDIKISQIEANLKVDIAQLGTKVEKYRYDSLKFTVWTGIGVVVFLSGLLAKGFHWL